MKRFQLSGIAALVAVLTMVGLRTGAAPSPETDSPPGNPLFYGEWYRHEALEPLARGETWVDMVTVRLTPGEAVTRRGAQITLRREFDLIKDFGDRMIVAITTSQPGSEIRTTLVGVLSLTRNMTWDGEPATIEGRAVFQLSFRHCYGKKSQEFSIYVLNALRPSERWRRIQGRSNEEIRGERFVLPGSCAIDANGKPRGFYTAIDYYRILSAEEQVRSDAGNLGSNGEVEQLEGRE